MGRIHRYGQTKNCLIFNYVATNTIEGRVLQRLLDKLQEIRNALNDDAVFNVVGEVLPATQIERVLRDYYAGHLGDADLEDRLLLNVDEGRFRAICQNALEGLASKRLNLEMLIERRAKAKSAASFQRPLRASFPTLRDFRGSPSRPCRRSRTHMIRAARRTFSRTTSGTRTGVCHRSLRSIPGYPRIARQRTLRIWNLLIVAFARNGTVIPHGEFLIEPDFHRLAVFIGVALLKRIVTGENMDGCFQALFCARPCHGLAGHLS